MLVIDLPEQFDGNGLYIFLGKVINQNREPMDSHIIFDFSKLKWIEPSGVVVLSNAMEWLSARNITYQYKNINIPQNHIKYDPIAYLDDSQFFATYIGKVLRNGAKHRATTIPLCRVSHSESSGWLESCLLSWLSDNLSVSRSSLSNIDVCIREIFNNILDHSGVKMGCIFAQLYPNKHEVVIALSDFGIGIPNKISKIKADLCDQDAILLASQEGISSKSLKTNRGVGLNLLIQNVVDLNGGSLKIASGSGILKCGRSGEKTVRTPVSAPGFYPGTFIELRMRTDMIKETGDDREEFEW